MTSILEKRVVYKVPGMDDVQIFRDIVYSTSEPTYCLLDIYRPADKTIPENNPAIIFIHGGPVGDWGIHPKDIGQYRSYGRLLAAVGFVAVTFNHRLFGLNSLPDSEKDLTDAIEFIRKNHQEYYIDPDSMVLWAVSYGCPLLSIPLKKELKGVRALISYYGPLDVLPTDERHEQALFQGYSPLAALSTGCEKYPILVVKAGFDEEDINNSIDAFMRRAVEISFPIQLLVHETGPHAFDILKDDDTSKDIIQSTIQFIKDTMSAQ